MSNNSDWMENSWLFGNYTIEQRLLNNQSQFTKYNESFHKYVICANQMHLGFSNIQQTTIQICMIASVVSFLLQILVYCFVPKLQNLPGKCLMSLSLALLITNLFLIMSYDVEISRKNVYCVLIGIGKHYFNLAAFCWMSVLAFDTHWTFGLPGNRFASYVSGINGRKSTFIKYSIYSWFTPAIMVGLAVITDNIKTSSNNVLKPLYGEMVCGISQFTSLLVWQTIPCCIILMANIILFVKTLQKLNHITEETELANKTSIKERFLWCLKLAIFLGIAWIIHLISGFVCEIWLQYFANLILSCEGILILFITTLKKNVFDLLKRRVYYIRNNGVINRQLSSRRSIQASASIRKLPQY